MSFRNNLNQYLRLRPYIQFDKDDYMRQLFHFDGTTVIYNNGDIYKHRYMYVYDVESKSFIWTDDLRQLPCPSLTLRGHGLLYSKPSTNVFQLLDSKLYKVCTNQLSKQ